MSEGRTYGGQTAQARADRRRRQLLDAGLELFGTAGYRRTTVREICRAAKVADRYFYELFPGTEDLLLAVYTDCLDRLQDAVLGAVAGLDDDMAQAAHAGLDAFFAAVQDDPRLARVVWFEVLGVSPRLDAEYLGRTNGFGELLLQLMDERGLLPRLPADAQRVLLSAAVGGVSQVVLQWVHSDFATPRERLVEPLVGFLLAGADVALGGPAPAVPD